jgi:preprotein translocase subunit SecA
MRKRVLQYDDVLNKQREVRYSRGNDIFHSASARDLLVELIDDTIFEKSEELLATSDVQGLPNWANITFSVAMVVEKELENLSLDATISVIGEKVRAAYALKAEAENSEEIDALERFVVLRTIDRC